MMAIVGSRAVQLYYNDLRTAGAQVRKVLLQNAAQKWGVDAATLKTEPGVVVNPANGARLSYGEIAAFGTVPATLPAVDAKELKAKSDFRLIGKTVPRRDTPLEGERYRAIRHRREAARHGLRDRAACAGAHRRAGELERRRDQGDARASSRPCGCPTASPSWRSISSRRWRRARRSR